MLVLPAATPDTRPEVVGMVAIVISLLLQVPPGVVLLRDVVDPAQTAGVPAIAAGVKLTVTPVVVIQPVDNVKVITEEPADIPETKPLLTSTEACALLLVHVPVPDVLLNGVVRPAQTAVAPVVADGNGFTVTVVVLIQPVG